MLQLTADSSMLECLIAAMRGGSYFRIPKGIVLEDSNEFWDNFLTYIVGRGVCISKEEVHEKLDSLHDVNIMVVVQLKSMQREDGNFCSTGFSLTFADGNTIVRIKGKTNGAEFSHFILGKYVCMNEENVPRHFIKIYNKVLTLLSEEKAYVRQLEVVK